MFRADSFKDIADRSRKHTDRLFQETHQGDSGLRVKLRRGHREQVKHQGQVAKGALQLAHDRCHTCQVTHNR